MTEEQLAATFRDHYSRAVRYLMKRGEDYDTAEDMVQAAFIRMAQLNSITSAPGFLMRACRNRSIDAARLWRIHRRKYVEWRAEQDWSPTPEDEVLATEAREQRERCIARLSLTQRERGILLAWYGHGTHRSREQRRADAEALAARFGLSVKSLGTTLERLRAKARAQLMEPTEKSSHQLGWAG